MRLSSSVLRIVLLAAIIASPPLRLASGEPRERDRKTVEDLLARRPPSTSLDIEWREITALQGRHNWHIGASHWWARLHPENVHSSRLDTKKRYRVEGVVLDQAYGTVDIWVRSIHAISPAGKK